MASENKDKIEPDSKRARMSPESEVCLKEDKENLDRALKRLEAGEDLITEDIEEIVFYAVANSYIHLLDDLLQKGAKVEISEIFENKREIVSKLLENNSNCNIEDLVYWAIGNGSVEILKTLLKNDYIKDINAKNSDGDTYLIRACARDNEGQIEIVKLLLEKGVDVNVKSDFMQMTALHYAAYKGTPEMVQELLKHNPNMDDTNEYGKSPLFWAIHNKKRRLEIGRLLLTNGCNVNLQDNAGNTALCTSVVWNDTEFMALLLEQGANVRVGDSGLIPLESILLIKDEEMLKLFLNFSDHQDLNIRDDNKKTPFELVVQIKKFTAAAKMLAFKNF